MLNGMNKIVSNVIIYKKKDLKSVRSPHTRLIFRELV